MELEARISSAVSELLAIEHRKFGHDIGLLGPCQKLLTHALLMELVYGVDELSWSSESYVQGQAVQLVVLTWEHATQVQRNHLRSFFVTALSRLGVSPSASMLEQVKQQDGKLGSLGSYKAELATTILQLQYFVQLGRQGYYLSRFQKKVLDAIAEHQVVGVSAPTSAGKSYALYLAILRHALKSASSVVYLVPTISLINQVSSDIRKLFEDHGLEDWNILTSYQAHTDRCVYVLTQERVLPGAELNICASIGMLIVDEVQNLEKVDDEWDVRGKILFDALRELQDSSSSAHIVLSGPRVRDIAKLGMTIFALSGIDIETSQSPVASITYGVSSRSGSVLLTQYSEFSRQGRSLKVDHPELVKGLGQSRYTPEFLDYLRSVVDSLGQLSSNVVFSPTAAQARHTALRLARPPISNQSQATSRIKLASYFAESIHPKYDLVECARSGVGFHTGKVPPHARLVTELAFSDGVLKDMVCTTTLMQGVNMPAKVVLVRNPNLFINRQSKRSNSVLSPYEFANLRGRAGRLMRDFVGRTLVLDEDAFVTDSNQDDLFPEAEKAIAGNYAGLFAKNRTQVIDELLSPSDSKGATKFLATYVRQTLLRQPEGGRANLAGVGLSIPNAVLNAVNKGLKDLDVGRNVCLANRYWDPVDLQRIKDNMASDSLPKLPNDPWSASESLIEQWLGFQFIVAPAYFERYLGDKAEKRIQSYAISSVQWARELPLNDIIRKRHFTGEVSKKIDQQVSDIQKRVVYGIPALLKPIADIQGGGHGLLASIEHGAFSQATQLLLRQGLYRETAVHIRRKLLPSLGDDEDELSSRAYALVNSGISKLSYWVERQIRPLLPQWKREVSDG